jgi:hypothetical protein
MPYRIYKENQHGQYYPLSGQFKTIADARDHLAYLRRLYASQLRKEKRRCKWLSENRITVVEANSDGLPSDNYYKMYIGV